MPNSITITGQRYGGTYTYYTKAEAEEMGIKYHIPPFGPADVPRTGWVLTSNDYVVPIIDAVQRYVSGKHRYFDYITPFGRIKYSEFAFMDGRTHTRGVMMNHVADSAIDKRNMAYHHVRIGDAALAWRLAYGYTAPPDLDDHIRDPQYQLILSGEYQKMAEEVGMPKGFIIEHRQRQTAALTEMIEVSKEVILKKLRESEELNETEMTLFLKLFGAQQENMTDLEKGYVRAPMDDGDSSQVLEAGYMRVSKQLPANGGFHMERAIKTEDTMDDVDLTEGLKHPDGFHDIDYDDNRIEDAEEVSNDN